MITKRKVQNASKSWECWSCNKEIPKGMSYIRDFELVTLPTRSTITKGQVVYHLSCAPTDKETIESQLRWAGGIKPKEWENPVNVNALPCKVCGLDNRNNTHDELHKAGHLSHSFQPDIPDPLAKKEPDVADPNRTPNMEFSPTEEMTASLRHIALNGCRCESEDDLFGHCACDAARTAQLTLEQLGIPLIPMRQS